jgi:hypothetical protein
MNKALLHELCAWWKEAAQRNAIMLDDQLARVTELEVENAQLRQLHKLNIDALEEEHATEASRARTKELSDSIRISDLITERDQWLREYQELKARYDALDAKWTRLNRELDDWDDWYWGGMV